MSKLRSPSIIWLKGLPPTAVATTRLDVATFTPQRWHISGGRRATSVGLAHDAVDADVLDARDAFRTFTDPSAAAPARAGRDR